MMEKLGNVFDDPKFRELLGRFGFTAEDLAAGEAAAEAQRQRNLQRAGKVEGPLVLGPPSTWALDGSERYGEPGYRCHVCRDTGWVRREAPLGTADFGHAFTCECMTGNADIRRERQAQRLATSGLDEGLLRCTLDTFERLQGTEKALAAIDATLEAHRTRDDRGRWLVIGGGPGRGKTHLLAAAVPMAALLDGVKWASVPDLLAAMAEDSFALADDYTRVMLQAPILILDEFGAAGSGDWARERLERILNHRYADKLTTLVGLTAPFKAIEAWSERIASRLADERLARRVELACGDYRRRKENVA